MPTAKQLPDGFPFHIGERPVVTRDAQGKIIDVTFVPLTEEDFLHPQEEDRFMLTDAHSIAVAYLRYAIETHCSKRPGIHVLSDHRIDWQQGKIKPHGPDVVAFDNFPSDWDPSEGTFPVVDRGAEVLVVFEVTSESTREIDFGKKFEEFAKVGIPYYLIVDTAEPSGAIEILGYQLSGRKFKEMPRDPDLGYFIPGLKMWFRWDDDDNRVYATNEAGANIPEGPEYKAMLEAEKQRGDAEQRRADTAELRADTAELRAEAEKQRADELARELAELRSRHSMNGKPNSN